MDLRVNGPGGRLCTVRLSTEEKVQDLKAAIEASIGVPVMSQRLFHGAREMKGIEVLGGTLSTEDELLLVRRTEEEVNWLRRVEQMWIPDCVERWLASDPAGAAGHKEVVLAAVATSGHALQFASPELRADRDVVLAAVAECGPAFAFASEELRADRGFVLAAIAANGSALQFASAELRADPDVVLAAVAERAAYASPERHITDRDRRVMNSYGGYGSLCPMLCDTYMGKRTPSFQCPFQFAPPEVRSDWRFVLAAVARDRRALMHAEGCCSLQPIRRHCSPALRRRAMAAAFDFEGRRGARWRSPPEGRGEVGVLKAIEEGDPRYSTALSCLAGCLAGLHRARELFLTTCGRNVEF